MTGTQGPASGPKGFALRLSGLAGLAAFALPLLSIGVPNCGTEPTQVTDGIAGYEMLVGGPVEVSSDRGLDAVTGLINDVRDGVGHIDPVATAWLIVVVLVTAVGLSYRKARRSATDVLTLDGVLAIGGMGCWVWLGFTVKARMEDTTGLVLWDVGGFLLIASLLTMFVASHREATRGRVSELPWFVSVNLVYGLVLMIVGKDADISAFVMAYVVAFNLASLGVKWLIYRRRAQRSAAANPA